MASSSVVNKPLDSPGNPAARTRPRPGFRAAALRTVLFIALAAVVLGFGIVAGSPGSPDAPASFSETALIEARTQARGLAAEAQALAADARGPAAAEYRAQADSLRDQAALLTAPGREAVSTGRAGTEESLFPSDAAVDSTGGSTSEKEAAERYLRQLSDSAETNLQAARRADRGSARLLAAAGAAQRVWAVRTADLYALPLPDGFVSGEASGEPSGQPSGGSGSGSSGRAPSGASPSAASPSPSPASPSAASSSPASGRDAGNCPAESPSPAAGAAGTSGTADADTASALQGVIEAELGAAYAYEVALARDPAAAARGAQWRALAADHESRGMAAVPFLAEVCLPPVAPVAAYRLSSEFLQDPAGSLPALEARFPAVYADLVALSDGSLRRWAVEHLCDVSMDLYRDGKSVPAVPGLDAEPENLPWN